MICEFHLKDVQARCPVEETVDHYECKVTTCDRWLVEQVLEVAGSFAARRILQEDLTVEMADRLHARVTTTGVHSGVTLVVTEDRR